MKKSSSASKSLFSGEVVEENFFPFPNIDEEEAEMLRMVLDSVDKFMGPKMEQYREYDESGAQPEEYIAALKELGLFGLIIDEEFGGLGLSNSAYSRVIQQTSSFDASTSLTIGAHSSIGMKGLLLFGNKEQKAKYLPKLASGEMIASFCLTESGAGSDAASVKTKAQKNEDGSWTLSGEKIWITNGAFAEFFTVFAKTDSDDGRMSAFIVERSFAGVESGPKEDKMGIRASATTTISFNNVNVPAENLLGEEGKGFKIAMAVLNNGRTGLGGGSVGAMKQCINAASQQAADRKQFDTPIAEFGLIQEKISQMTVDCFATESLVAMVGYYIDSDFEDYSVEAAISKIFASEALWETANSALQIAGGNGFMKEYPYEKVVRDSRINLIFEGTNEILRLYVALSGMKEAGVELKEISKALSGFMGDPSKGCQMAGKFAKRKLSHATSIGRSKLNKVHLSLSSEAKTLSKYTALLNKRSDQLLIKYKKDIINRQFELKRLANINIDIFTGLCVLSRVTSMIEESSVEKRAKEISIAKLFVHQAEKRMKLELSNLKHNLDTEVAALSQSIVENEGYKWDTV